MTKQSGRFKTTLTLKQQQLEIWHLTESHCLISNVWNLGVPIDLTFSSRSEHITPVWSKSVHWFPVSYYIDIAMLVEPSLNSLGLEYINNMLNPVGLWAGLGPESQRAQTKHGEVPFSYFAAHWNKLPTEVKSTPCVTIFMSRLKTSFSPCGYASAQLFKL